MWCSQLGLQTDVAQDDHLVVVGRPLACPREQRDRIFVVSGEELLIGPHHALGRACQAFAGGVVAGPFDQRPHRRFRLCLAGPSAPARVDENGCCGRASDHCCVHVDPFPVATPPATRGNWLLQSALATL